MLNRGSRWGWVTSLRYLQHADTHADVWGSSVKVGAGCGEAFGGGGLVFFTKGTPMAFTWMKNYKWYYVLSVQTLCLRPLRLIHPYTVWRRTHTRCVLIPLRNSPGVMLTVC